MDKCKRYKVKAPDRASYEAAIAILVRESKVVLTNRSRNTISVEGLEEATARKLRDMDVSATEEGQYDLE